MGKKNVGSPVEEAVEAIPPEPSSNGQAPPPEPDPEPRRPAQEFRLGSTVAVIWENETQLGKRYSVQFFRLFKNDQGQWKGNDTQFGYFAVNPIDRNGVVISSSTGQVFRTQDAGQNSLWVTSNSSPYFSKR